MIKSWTQMYFRLAALLLLFVGGMGCNDGGGSNSNDGATPSGGGANAFTGTWLITKEGKPAYWVFNSDGTFQKNRAGEPAGGAVHFTGTYSVKSNSLEGEFSNAGVGTGEIKAQIVEGGGMKMDFIEYWHSPPKVVPCTGVRQ